MQYQALIISNNRHSMTYSSGLCAFGFDVQDTHCLDSASVWLADSYQPQAIIVDMKHHADEVLDFLVYLRAELRNTNAYVIVIGCQAEIARRLGADKCLPRPTTVNELIATLQSAF